MSGAILRIFVGIEARFAHIVGGDQDAPDSGVQARKRDVAWRFF